MGGDVAPKNIDAMTREGFEQYCAALLKVNGSKDIVLTKKSKDRGVDIIARS